MGLADANLASLPGTASRHLHACLSPSPVYWSGQLRPVFERVGRGAWPSGPFVNALCAFATVLLRPSLPGEGKLWVLRGPGHSHGRPTWVQARWPPALPAPQ